MIDHLKELVDKALLDLKRDGFMPETLEPAVHFDRTKNPEHGDFATNIALTLAKPLGKPPRNIAQAIVDELVESPHVEKVEIAGPGFINFHLTKQSQRQVVKKILKKGHDFGRNNLGQGLPTTVEFVSANPTGPLHVGHGRGAAYGSSLANILEKSGYDVQREYYVNDHGRQMDILATSVWLRYLELCGERIPFPDNGYQGDYIIDIARKVRNQYGDDFRFSASEVYELVPPDEKHGGDKEKHIDGLVQRAKELLGEENYQAIFQIALNTILDGIREDLEAFNVHYDQWFSERSLHENGTVSKVLNLLEEKGYLYHKDGAVWFRATHFGDEKDRVVMRENGLKTYFASDIAYLWNKFERGFKDAIYVFGADHHGYIPRLKAAAKALDLDPQAIEILLVQFAHLFRSGEKVQMSTRSGSFVTLRQLIEEVGTDAARFFYVMRSHEQHLDFDLDLAKSQSNDNPVYYVQYAHARICSIFRKFADAAIPHNVEIGNAALQLLESPQEVALLRTLSEYPDIIQSAARNRAPHLLSNYLRELAQHFHSWYNSSHLIDEIDENLRNAQLNLAKACQIVLADGLGLLGISAPQRMDSSDSKARNKQPSEAKGQAD